jgi:hypothetical protein
MAFDDYYRKNGTVASTLSIEQLKKEIHERERVPNPFPLDVFHDAVKPFINCLNYQYDLPKSYIGLSMLAEYSTSIGTAYCVSTNGRDNIFLPVWSCLIGISSSGKTLAIDKIFEPLNEIQNGYDAEWNIKTAGLKADKISRCKLETVIYREAHIPTLVRWILPDNPKGVMKWNDELIEWINGLNQLSKKEGTDEQFWISSWNCKPYSGIRSGKQKFVNTRPFVNIIGGMQPTILWKLFGKDRDTTGFVFRLLFAKPEHDRIAEPDGSFELPTEQYNIHRNSLSRLFHDLKVEFDDYEPKKCILTREAYRRYNIWVKKKIRIVNSLDDISDKEVQSGILGKIKEYILRFSAILTLRQSTGWRVWPGRRYEVPKHRTRNGRNYGTGHYHRQLLLPICHRNLRRSKHKSNGTTRSTTCSRINEDGPVVP